MTRQWIRPQAALRLDTNPNVAAPELAGLKGSVLGQPFQLSFHCIR